VHRELGDKDNEVCNERTRIFYPLSASDIFMPSRKTAFEVGLLQDFELDMCIQHSSFKAWAEAYTAKSRLQFPGIGGERTEMCRKRITEAFFR
jgi:hypothetical protein